MSGIVLPDPELTPCRFQQFSRRGNFFIFKDFRGRLNEKRAAATQYR